VWEIYTKGRLERMGVDDNYDSHVDRWDRDDQLRREQEEAENKVRAAMAEAGAPVAPPPAAAPDAGGGKDAGAPKKK
jgi:hypothetical protein